MGVTYCDYSDLPVEGCAHCRGVVASAEPTPTAFRAEYSGECASCGGVISPGDLITSYGRGQYQHRAQDCA